MTNNDSILNKIRKLFKKEQKPQITLLTKPSFIGKLVKIKPMMSMSLEEESLVDFCYNGLSKDKYTEMQDVIKSTIPMLCIEEIEDWQMMICLVKLLYNNEIVYCFKCHCEIVQ